MPLSSIIFEDIGAIEADYYYYYYYYYYKAGVKKLNKQNIIYLILL